MNEKQTKELGSLWSAAELFAQCLSRVYSPRQTAERPEEVYKTTADLRMEFEPMCPVELIDAAYAIQDGGYEVAELGGCVYWKLWRAAEDFGL